MTRNKALVFFVAILALISGHFAAPAAAQGESGIQAEVRIDRLNVRRVPRAAGSILGVLVEGDVVPLVGRNELATWLEAVTPFGTGWIDARYVRTNSSIVALPVTTDFIPPFATVTTSAPIIIRSGPLDAYPVVQRVRFGTEMDVIGLHSQNTHVQVIAPNGQVGWASLRVVVVTGDLSALRFTDLEVLPLARVNTFRLRVRAAPDLAAEVIGTARLGQLYTITALDETQLWGQISGKFGTGWVLLGLTEVIGTLAPLLPMDH
jgi:uncharacterized protein YgiM (DUF1202 family)